MLPSCLGTDSRHLPRPGRGKLAPHRSGLIYPHCSRRRRNLPERVERRPRRPAGLPYQARLPGLGAACDFDRAFFLYQPGYSTRSTAARAITLPSMASTITAAPCPPDLPKCTRKYGCCPSSRSTRCAAAGRPGTWAASAATVMARSSEMRVPVMLSDSTISRVQRCEDRPICPYVDALASNGEHVERVHRRQRFPARHPHQPRVLAQRLSPHGNADSISRIPGHRLFVPQCHHRLNPGRAARRNH
jgi:hypothetical protein